MVGCASVPTDPGIEPGANGVTLHLPSARLRAQVWSDSVVRITYSHGDSIPELHSFSVISKPASAKWSYTSDTEQLTLRTAALVVKIDRKSGTVSFCDATGRAILDEARDGHAFAPPTTQAVTSNSIKQSFVLDPAEGIYGLGQHQQGFWNYRGHTVHLQQQNMEVGLPVLLSSKGYGILWDNPSITDIAAGVAGSENRVNWTSESGKAIDYYFMYGPSADGVIKDYRTLSGAAPMFPEWFYGFWQCKERYRTQEEILSVAAKYREMKVPIDGIIQDWRYWPEGQDTWGSHVFDKARYPDPPAMFGQLHAMGFHTLISVWPKFDVGSANYNELNDAGAMFEPVMTYVFPPGKGKWYDPFNPKGREIYWNQISRSLFPVGVDGWWLDAPEPELSGKWGEFRNTRTAMGPGADVFNAYPLMHSTGIYQGERATTSEKRVVILTRSAFAGQQRNAAITWSGDIGSTWQVLQNQVPAGLNFSVSGIPYWNTDIGGFAPSNPTGRMNPADPRYQELFARWFQFGSFCPMFRVHGSAPSSGTGPGKEIWRFDEKTQQMWRNFVNLRYRLMPYLYSVAWNVTSDGGTMMRPLVMDFRNDPNVLNIGDQYLFGPSIMVNPVTQQGAISRSVYLPAGNKWYDFWTGKMLEGGQTITAPAPVETMPLYIRAGSILPMGPLIQYTAEKPADPIEIRVYRGANGSFAIYEDEGDSYRYEKGVFATIPISWDESSATLTIGRRIGQFPGMLKERTFHIVWISEDHGAGVSPTDRPDVTVKYDGALKTVRFERP